MDGITSNQSTVVSHIRQSDNKTGTFNNAGVSTPNAEPISQVRQALTNRLANTPTLDVKARKILADALANLSTLAGQARRALNGWLAEAKAELEHCDSARHPIPKSGAQLLFVPAEPGYVPE